MLEQIIQSISNFDLMHWILIAVMVVLLLSLLVFNKGSLKAKEIIERNESEIKELKTRLSEALASNEKLRFLVGDNNGSE